MNRMVLGRNNFVRTWYPSRLSYCGVPGELFLTMNAVIYLTVVCQISLNPLLFIRLWALRRNLQRQVLLTTPLHCEYASVISFPTRVRLCVLVRKCLKARAG